MLVRTVESRTPHLARQRVPNRQTASAYLIGFVIGIIPHFFSLGALVHICIPQTDTPCGEMSLAERSYLLSWATSSVCLSSSLCTYYSTLLVVCQEVFEKISNFFQLRFPTKALSSCVSFYPRPLDILIIAHLVLFVKSFLKLFSKFFQVLQLRLVCNCPPSHRQHNGHWVTSSLDYSPLSS